MSCKYQNQNKGLCRTSKKTHSIVSAQDITELVKVVNRCNFKNVLEKICIYKEIQMNNQTMVRSA
jgi:hypothetical protein